ncbi:MAG: acetyltransferase [Clostridia bacterium]|nr:acetyltransferase [Clostridia bacterium]
MNGNLIIIGAGGHGRVIADIAVLCGYTNIGFLDDGADLTVPILGKTADFRRYLTTHSFFVAIGNNAVRERITNDLASAGAALPSLIHPSAVIGSHVRIGDGTAVMAGAVINTGASLGRGVIVNTCASADHDCTVCDFAHVSVGAHLAGTISVGPRTMIGVGAAVINNISICGDCTVGAGAVVIRDITVPGTYVGVPAKKL